MSEIVVREERSVAMPDGQAEMIAALREVVQEFQGAMQIMAMNQQAMARKLDELEREVRWSVPVTQKQAKLLNEQIKSRAEELCAKAGRKDKETVKRLSRVIRKSLLIRYGVSSVKDIPKIEYPVAVQAAAKWFEIYAIREATG